MTQKIILGGGCFWCIEGVFNRVNGVISAVSGYTGGEDANPTYKQVCNGDTGHVEVVEITFDDTKIGLEQILNIFFEVHDPTTLNRQGHDVGTQYRSAIFFTNPKQGEMVEYYVQNLRESDKYDGQIVTEVKPLDIFYKAEDYHQDYYNQNPNQGYCRIVIAPKLEKLAQMDLKDK